MPEILGEAEFWVGIGLAAFLAIVIYVGAHKKIAASLDATAATIQADLDEAARIRKEAEDMLTALKAQREQAEQRAAEMMVAAEADAKRLAQDAKVKLEEQIKRRADLAERKIASAEAQAMSEVKAIAADMAASAAEKILVDRLAVAKSDPLVDDAIKTLASRLQ